MACPIRLDPKKEDGAKQEQSQASCLSFAYLDYREEKEKD
jgi:hypothetical protein